MSTNLSNPLKQEIYDILEQREDSIISPTSDWVNMKCPICDGNSDKHHFYILMTDNGPMMCNCFRAGCLYKKVLDRKMARVLGIRKPELLDYIDKERMMNKRYGKSAVEYHSNALEFELDDPNYIGPLGEISDEVEAYFYKRTHKSAREYQQLFRICSDIEYFFKYAGRKTPEDTKKRIRWREKRGKYIYFFNDTFTMLQYRQIDGKMKGKMSLVKSDNKLLKHKPYIIPKEPISEDNGVNIVIAEGVFDIINTYLYFSKKEDTGYYVTTTGFASTMNVLREMTKYHYMSRITIMADSDVNIKKIRSLLLLNKRNNIDDRISSLEVKYNEKGKDVGDIEERVSIKRYKLK